MPWALFVRARLMLHRLGLTRAATTMCSRTTPVRWQPPWARKHAWSPTPCRTLVRASCTYPPHTHPMWLFSCVRALVPLLTCCVCACVCVCMCVRPHRFAGGMTLLHVAAAVGAASIIDWMVRDPTVCARASALLVLCQCKYPCAPSSAFDCTPCTDALLTPHHPCVASVLHTPHHPCVAIVLHSSSARRGPPAWWATAD